MKRAARLLVAASLLTVTSAQAQQPPSQSPPPTPPWRGGLGIRRLPPTPPHPPPPASITFTSEPARGCEGALWGCREPSGAGPKSPEARYEQLCKQARETLLQVQNAGTGSLGDSLAQATEAAHLVPEQPLAWALLGLLYLEARRLDEAGPILQRAAALALTPLTPPTVQPEPPPLEPGVGGPLDPGAADPATTREPRRRTSLLDSQLDLQVQLGLVLWLAQRGELQAAEEQTRRLLQRRGPGHRVLWRLGDLLMAQGRLEEATAVYGRACKLSRPLNGLAVELSRSCFALAVALDRGQRTEVHAALSRALSYDRDRHALLMPDFLPEPDRDYYRAVASSLLTGPPVGCASFGPLSAYLQQARERPDTPPSYLRRAEQRLEALGPLRCAPPPPPQPAPSPPSPLGP